MARYVLGAVLVIGISGLVAQEARALDPRCASYLKTSPPTPDYDSDGRVDKVDNCPFVKNESQLDTDADKVGDACDLCPKVSDSAQLDTDGDGIGDACDKDIDNDGILNAKDNCPGVSNNFAGKQPDADKDGQGDACDDDDDGDGVLDAKDNCPLVHNPQQLGSDPATYGEKCDNDTDLDNIEDSRDNCPMVANADQKDGDGDGKGDVCDLDRDGDGLFNVSDNCPDAANKDQLDRDGDGKGDACDTRYCYVVYGEEKHCLDPKLTFRVFSPQQRVTTGEQVRLRIFANRESVAIKYRWGFVKWPEGSGATIENDEGQLSVSCPYEYLYPEGREATVRLDKPGTYVLGLRATLEGADKVNPAWPRESGYNVTIEADGDAVSLGGCGVAGASEAGAGAASVATLLLVLGLLLRRTRRG